MKMEELRKQLGITSQGRVSNREDSVLFHLCFRMDKTAAEKLIREAANMGLSEAMYGRLAILEKLSRLPKAK